MGPSQQGHYHRKSRKMGNGQRKLDLLNVCLLIFKNTQLVINTLI